MGNSGSGKRRKTGIRTMNKALHILVRNYQELTTSPWLREELRAFPSRRTARYQAATNSTHELVYTGITWTDGKSKFGMSKPPLRPWFRKMTSATQVKGICCRMVETEKLDR